MTLATPRAAGVSPNAPERCAHEVVTRRTAHRHRSNRAFVAATVQASTASADTTITWVTAAGSFDSEIGCASDWMPCCAAAHLTLGPDGWWRNTFTIPAGSYQYKAAINDTFYVSWGDNGGSGNINMVQPADGPVTIVFDPVVPPGGRLARRSVRGRLLPEPTWLRHPVAVVPPELATRSGWFRRLHPDLRRDHGRHVHTGDPDRLRNRSRLQHQLHCSRGRRWRDHHHHLHGEHARDRGELHPARPGAAGHLRPPSRGR